jgi:hypothetical protein
MMTKVRNPRALRIGATILTKVEVPNQPLFIGAMAKPAKSASAASVQQ